MPETRYWLVTQTRQVRVTANTLKDSVDVAQAAFNDEDHDFRDIGGFVQSPVREISILSTEDR